jgi:glycosyltransferase involved in cell wall biosynthesis
MPPTPPEGNLSVVHFGNDPGSVRGGIAAVIRQHLAHPGEGVSVSAAPTYDPTGAGWRRNAPYARALRRALRLPSGGDAIGHVHVSQGGSLLREGLVVTLLRLRRVPVVVTLHGSSSLTATGPKFRLTALVLRLATVAHFLSEAHRSRYAGAAGRHVTIPNAVALDAGAIAKQPDVVFAGVVGTRKGVDLLVEAWRSVPSAGWRLHLYGPVGDDYSVPEGIPGLLVHGEVAPAVVQTALSAASIAVLPSREEAFPMFLLEAMAHRCAVVATDVGGVRELLGDAGAVVPSENADALAAALTRLVTDESARAELSAAAGRRIAERFDSAVVARAWTETYGSLARAGASSAAGGPGAG